MCIEVKAISAMLDGVRFQAITLFVCLTDSMSPLAKIQIGMLHVDLVASIGQAIYNVSGEFSAEDALVYMETSGLMS